MTDRCAHLLSIISEQLLTPLFQPIIESRSGQVIGYEALIRGPSDSPLHSPLCLFDLADQCGLQEPLDLLCREISIREFVAQQGQGLLFLNVNPGLLLHQQHAFGATLQYLQHYGLDASRVVIELSERYQVEQADLLQRAVVYYRQLGFKIAIDDLGSGFSGLRLWSELKPDIIKIDRYFINQLEQDATKQAFVKSMIELALSTGSDIVAEGIETAAESEFCQQLGATYLQGYFHGRPDKFARPPKQIVPTLTAARVDSRAIGDFCQPWPLLRAEQTIRQADEVFSQLELCPALAIIDQGHIIGVITRQQLQTLYASPFGRALYDRKPVKRWAQPVVMDCDEQADLDEVCQQLSQQTLALHVGVVLIRRAQHYYGLVELSTLLEHQTCAKLHHARYANPLTGLAGSVPLHRHIDRLLDQGQPFHLAYLDLNHFKAFNDFYGYHQGDQVLLMLANLLQKEARNGQRFVAHIGGDDFMMLFQDGQWHDCLLMILQLFAQKAPLFYEAAERSAGGIHGLNRQGQPVFFPMLSLAIGVVQPDPRLCNSHHDVASLAASAKQQAKTVGENQLFVCRRRSVFALSA